MYLVDTNVWLEHLLNQAKAKEAKQFLTGVDASFLFLTYFSLHSLCVILGRSKRYAVIDLFIADVLIASQVTVLTIPAADTKTVTAAMQ